MIMRTRQKNMVIAGLLAIVLVMAGAYAAFAQNLTINATSTTDATWNVKITNIEVEQVNGVDNVSGTATIENVPTFSDTEAAFSSILRLPGDSITYSVTVKNEGSLKAKLASIKWVDEFGGEDTNAEKYCMIGQTVDQVLCTIDDPIYYEFDAPSLNGQDAIIQPNGTHTIKVTARYYSGFTYQPTLFPSYYITGKMPSTQIGTMEVEGNDYFEKDATLRLDYVQTK